MNRTNKCAWCTGDQLQLGGQSDGSAIGFKRLQITTGFAISAWCHYCDRPARPGYFEPHALFGPVEISLMPWLRVAGHKDNCKVCGKAALLELHHLARSLVTSRRSGQRSSVAAIVTNDGMRSWANPSDTARPPSDPPTTPPPHARADGPRE